MGMVINMAMDMGTNMGMAMDMGTNMGMAMVWTIAKKIDKNIGYEKF